VQRAGAARHTHPVPVLAAAHRRTGTQAHRQAGAGAVSG
jgi:hypothetical protein